MGPAFLYSCPFLFTSLNVLNALKIFYHCIACIWKKSKNRNGSCVLQATYDTNSIYEPITPRPSSQMSNRSTYSTASGISSLYSSGYSNSRSWSATSGNLPLSRSALGKEAELDHLTDLLVQSMDNSSDPDFFGECRERLSYQVWDYHLS